MGRRRRGGRRGTASGLAATGAADGAPRDQGRIGRRLDGARRAARTDVFRAGISRYGVGDARTLAADTHDFESRYLDGLIGPLPEAEDSTSSAPR
jgi:hypothetical protein